MKNIIIKLLIYYYLFRLFFSYIIFITNMDNNLFELDFYLVDNNFDNHNINYHNNIVNNENNIFN